MLDSTKKFLIDSCIGLAIAVIVWFVEGLFQVSAAADALRILSDGFFVAAAAFLGMGGLTWTFNGGVMDGLGFSFKTGLARMRSDYDTARMTFAEYREEREKKKSSPKSMLLAGLVHLVLALILFLVHELMIG